MCCGHGCRGVRLTDKQGDALIRIASWNVNSIRARLGLVTKWLQLRVPDVLLMQELKGTEFPTEIFGELGYESVSVRQKAYNGVAILSRFPVREIRTALPGNEPDDHARYLEVAIEGVRIINVYAPNGNPPGSDNFAYKLAWMDRLNNHLTGLEKEGIPTLIGGDFNVIPEDIDCHKPTSWMHDALFQPETRARFRELLASGYTDAFRSLHPGEGGQFTYWDYFRQAFERNRGIRIDHFLLSADLVGRLRGCEIDKAPRSELKPSDHTPIVLELA